MRNTPLPSMHKFEKVGIEEALKKQLNIGTLPNLVSQSKQAIPDLVSQSRQATPEEEREKLSKTFESAKTKKESRKKAFEDEKEKAKDAKKGLKGDEKKVARYNVQRVNREERKKRAEDRKQQWAEKRFLQGKYDSVDQAKKRFEGLQNITAKQNQNYQGIIGNIGGTPNDPDTDASEETYDANKATVTDASMSTDDYTKGFGSGVYGM